MPRYFHIKTGLVEHIAGTNIRNRDAAKRRLQKKVKDAGGDVEEIEYRAALGPGFRGQFGQ